MGRRQNPDDAPKSMGTRTPKGYLVYCGKTPSIPTRGGVVFMLAGDMR